MHITIRKGMNTKNNIKSRDLKINHKISVKRFIMYITIRIRLWILKTI